jgi:CRISPR type III-B/RAMP module-associated protein Cmr5
MTLKKNLELVRLQWAYQKVENVKEKKELATKYRSLARKVPFMIQSNGLANTLFFLKSKDAAEHKKMLAHLIEWSVNESALFAIKLTKENDGWMKEILEKPSSEIRSLTREFIMISGYLKRVAEAMIEAEKEKKPNTKTEQNA